MLYLFIKQLQDQESVGGNPGWDLYGVFVSVVLSLAV